MFDIYIYIICFDDVVCLPHCSVAYMYIEKCVFLHDWERRKKERMWWRRWGVRWWARMVVREEIRYEYHSGFHIFIMVYIRLALFEWSTRHHTIEMLSRWVYSYRLWNILTLVSLAVSMLLISRYIAVKMDGKLGRDLYRNNWSLTSISFLSKGKNDFI